ncbi:hypothetical protein EJ07DRAFT_172416 [Lizonia empirigonia]|nr:hypothetical protein EJ07DRAFT_172416 [Lizonia empirigonia]
MLSPIKFLGTFFALSKFRDVLEMALTNNTLDISASGAVIQVIVAAIQRTLEAASKSYGVVQAIRNGTFNISMLTSESTAADITLDITNLRASLKFLRLIFRVETRSMRFSMSNIFNAIMPHECPVFSKEEMMVYVMAMCLVMGWVVLVRQMPRRLWFWALCLYVLVHPAIAAGMVAIYWMPRMMWNLVVCVWLLAVAATVYCGAF